MALAAERDDVALVGGGQSGVADHLPRRLALVAAIDGVGEGALHEQQVEQAVEPGGKIERLAVRFSAADGDERCFALRRVQPVERLAVCAAAIAVQRRDAGLEPFLWRQRQLVAVLRFALAEGSLRVLAVAAPEGSGELP